MDQRTFVDLFSGVGGFLSGFISTGFRPLLSTDHDPICERAHQLNFPNVPFICSDVRDLSNELLDQIVTQKVDVLIGGPPCQGFSTIGIRASSDPLKRHRGDPRNELFVEYGRILKHLQPSVFVMENVKGILTLDGGQFFKRVVSMFEEAGYETNHVMLNAASFGVPQIRNRVFIYGTKFGIKLDHPRPILKEEQFRKVGDAISDLAGIENSVPNHVPLRHGEINLRRYRLIPEGGRMPEHDLHPDIYRKNFGNTFKRLHRNKPSLTMVPGHNAFPIHPWLDRSLTVREAARLQGFDDKMIFCGTRQQQCTLVGNAVPPLLSKAWAETILASLNNINFPK